MVREAGEVVAIVPAWGGWVVGVPKALYQPDGQTY